MGTGKNTGKVPEDGTALKRTQTLEAIMQNGIRVLDLFCGMGGLALGFTRNDFHVTGYDINPWVPQIFKQNLIGEAITADLSEPDGILESDRKGVVIITGGPPCRPWSSLNLRRRGPKHPDYRLLKVFFQLVRDALPEAFLMENVSMLVYDEGLDGMLRPLSFYYHIQRKVLRYADFGTSTARHRLILTGFRKRTGVRDRAEMFFRQLETRRCPPLNAGEVLAPYMHLDKGRFPDHVWPEFRTIERYEDKYRTGRYGWYKVNPERPVPSFGNIMKTYILHPYAGNGAGVPLRVLSVREAMALMGFDDSIQFPEGMSMQLRYQMVADTVSPVFSRICGELMQELLE